LAGLQHTDNVRSGNFAYFDRTTHTFRPERRRLSRHRDRGRALLGRRLDLKHASAVGGRWRAEAGHAGSSRSATGPRPVSFPATWPRSRCAMRRFSIRAAPAPDRPIRASPGSALRAHAAAGAGPARLGTEIIWFSW